MKNRDLIQGRPSQGCREVFQSEQLLASVCKGWGFSLQKIKESNVSGEKRADYLIQDEESDYLCEVKDKLDDTDDLREFFEELKSGKVVGRKTPIDITPSISKKIREARKQIQQTPARENTFNIVWFYATGQHPDLKEEQLLTTLYGRHHIFELDNPNLTYCYHFTFNLFYELRDIVAVISSKESEERLCLNSFSDQYEAFKKTKLYGCFGDAVIDPLEQERKGEVYIADCDIGRKDEQAVSDYIAKKYNLQKIQVMKMNHISGTITIPKKDQPSDI